MSSQATTTASPSSSVYRAISRASHSLKRTWPDLAVPVAPQRWNRDDQPTIYTSHDPEVAAAEKLGQLARSGTLQSASAFWSTSPATAEVLVLSFDATVFRSNLADLSGMPNIGDFLTPDYEASQELAALLVASGHFALRAPSAVFWPDLRLNEAYFVTLAGQTSASVFPPVTECGWYKGGA